MDRDQFFAKLAVLDEDRLKKVLWNLYWRGSAPMRERIEAQLDPDENSSRPTPLRCSTRFATSWRSHGRAPIWAVTGVCRHANGHGGA
jgi:hypothetical protein